MHYRHLIQQFGAPNGLCSSITESKHIKAVKKPWRHSNRFEALGQMFTTNQRLDKLAAARVDFESCRMLDGSVLSAALQDVNPLHGEHDDTHEDLDNVDDDEIQAVDDGPCILNHVRLAKTPVRNIPTDLYTLARHIEVPNLPLLVHRFLESQLSNDTGLDIALPPDLLVSPVSVFHSAIATFYAPSDLSGLGGMHTECIRSTPCWRKAQARYDTVFLEQDPDIPGMGGLHVGRWFSTISDGPDEDIGMWIVQPDFNAGSRWELEVIHLNCILRGAHLIPVYGHDRLPMDIRHADSLDIFQAYYVNKYIDHHAFEVAF
ncbi:hypothetical protein SCLCIDRAFT_23455 [Scleroderma citrinum Foug A]|uniref:Uncharacterized protein n=1 Tax=Scleroderma citrinum Foug A TaxID=1036808 RepID=A0A0C3DV10_9AGAM|nr:hypothetical protein SCLCIDRAFT_23455 [Scleroderma citrinum Foug A]